MSDDKGSLSHQQRQGLVLRRACIHCCAASALAVCENSVQTRPQFTGIHMEASCKTAACSSHDQQTPSVGGLPVNSHDREQLQYALGKRFAHNEPTQTVWQVSACAGRADALDSSP